MTTNQDWLQKALDEGYLQFITSGKTEKLRCVVVDHSEKWSDPEEKVRVAYSLGKVSIVDG